MLDAELLGELRTQLPDGVPSVFISSVAGMGIAELKDLLWNALQE